VTIIFVVFFKDVFVVFKKSCN